MKTLLVSLGVVCLTQSAFAEHYEYCDPHKYNLDLAEGLCNGTMDVSDVCTTISNVVPIPFVGLLCAIPAMAAQLSCDRKEGKRKTYEECLVQEEKRAIQRARSQQAQSDRERWVRPSIETFIQRQNTILLGYDSEAERTVAFCYNRHQQIGDIDEPEALKECEDLDQWYQDHRHSAFRAAKHGIEEAWITWGWELQTLGYTEWDDFINKCIRPNGSARGCIDEWCVNDDNEKYHRGMPRCRTKLVI